MFFTHVIDHHVIDAVDSFFFFNDTATTEIYTLSLHDALPIFDAAAGDGARAIPEHAALMREAVEDRKSTRLNSSHVEISYAGFCLKKKKRLCPGKYGIGSIVFVKRRKNYYLVTGIAYLHHCSQHSLGIPAVFNFFFNDTATTEIYTLSLHDALPISEPPLDPEVARTLDDRVRAVLFEQVL